MRVWWLSCVSLVLHANFVERGLATVAHGTDKALRGVNPSVAAKYARPSSGLFECLDGSKKIPFEHVNDDYCDCPDGSDEPGTSACNNGSFYCANHGHIPGILQAIRVNDGVCDYDVCCDGSDEWDSGAQCEDRCGEIGAEYRRVAESDRKARSKGSRQLAELVVQARDVRVVKAAELETLRERIVELDGERAAAEKRKNELEEKQQVIAKAKEEREGSRRSTLDKLAEQYLPGVVAYRKLLAAELHGLRVQRDTLIRMLYSVRAGHNTEFNDQAVAGAIEKYAAYADAYPYMEAAAQEYADESDEARGAREAEMDRDNAEQDDKSLEACRSAVDIAESERETAEADIGLLLGLMRDLRAGYNKNYHDLVVKAAVESLRSFEETRDKDSEAAARARAEADFASLAIRVAEVKTQLDAIAQPASPDEGEADVSLGAVDGGDGGDDNSGELDKQVTEARSAFWDLQTQKNKAESDATSIRELLESTDLGPQDMYLPLKSECFELDAGEYKYEVCLLDRVMQTGNRDGQHQSLGTFEGFGNDHTVHRYTHGTKCWNGPERSLTATFVCAEEIKILSVSEPEKCEYHAKMTGPFACDLPAAVAPAAEDTAKDAADLAPSRGDHPLNEAGHGNGHNPHDEL